MRKVLYPFAVAGLVVATGVVMALERLGDKDKGGCLYEEE